MLLYYNNMNHLYFVYYIHVYSSDFQASLSPPFSSTDYQFQVFD